MGKVQTIKIKVIKEDGLLFQGDVRVVFVPDKKGEVAILPFHSPLILLLGEGVVRVISEQGDSQELCKTKSGVLYCGDNEVVVLVGV